MIVPILLIVLITYLFYPLYIGYGGALYVDFVLEVKNFSSHYYTFGISFIEHSTEDPEYVEQEFTIAMFLFSISLVFYKHKDDA